MPSAIGLVYTQIPSIKLNLSFAQLYVVYFFTGHCFWQQEKNPFGNLLWHQYTLTICNATILNGQHLNHEGKILHVSAYPHPKPSLLAKSITLGCIRQMETTTKKHSKLLKISIFWANVFIHSLFHIFARINVLVYIMVFQDVENRCIFGETSRGREEGGSFPILKISRNHGTLLERDTLLK